MIYRDIYYVIASVDAGRERFFESYRYFELQRVVATVRRIILAVLDPDGVVSRRHVVGERLGACRIVRRGVAR